MASMSCAWLWNSWGDFTFWLLLVGVVLAASSVAAIGTFILLEKRGMVGDAIGHAFLPGVCLAFMLTKAKVLWVLILGCFLSGGCALWVLDYLPRHKKIKRENSTALVLSIFLGVGILLLSHIQHSGDGAQVGLHHFLLGNVASLMQQDIWFFAGLNGFILLSLGMFFREWQLLVFDAQFGKATGRPVKLLRFFFYLLSLVAIVMGVQTVGIILMTAMLIAPAAGARFWTDRLQHMIGVAMLLASLGSALGVIISYKMPDLPTGPCIVAIMNTIAIISFLFAPKRGWISRKYRRYRYGQKMMEENILKWLYQMSTADREETKGGVQLDAMASRLGKTKKRLVKSLRVLASRQEVKELENGKWMVTERGKEKGKSIYRLHLLWEAYLKHYLGIQENHVHDDAESTEHVITPDLEATLVKLVGNKISLDPKSNHPLNA